jgi:hypothetical protein
LLKSVVKDLKLESIKEYTGLKKSGKLGSRFPKNLYSYCKCRTKELFGTRDFLSLDGLINLTHMGIDTPEKLERFKQKFPNFIPNNWKEHYGLSSITDLLECEDKYVGIDLPFLIESIHGVVEYKELHKSPERYFFAEDREAYIKVLKYLSNESYHEGPITGVLGEDKWKLDSIKNYLYFDGILKKTKYGIHQIGNSVQCKDLLKRIFINDHPICGGIKQDEEDPFFQKIHDYDARLANSRKTEVESEAPTQDSVEKVPESTINPVNEDNWELPADVFKDLNIDNDTESESTTDLIIEVDGIPIIYKNKAIKAISIDGNKIKITIK